jgi:hypothetical protein
MAGNNENKQKKNNYRTFNRKMESLYKKLEIKFMIKKEHILDC